MRDSDGLVPAEAVSGLSDIETQVLDLFADGVRVLGLPRSVGEIYGLLFISRAPMSLDDLVARLGISKGSASQGLRFLRVLGAVSESDGGGTRRTYYEPEINLKRLVGGFIREQVRPHLESGEAKLGDLARAVRAVEDRAERKFCAKRLEKLENWFSRGKVLLPLFQRVLGE